MKKTNLFVLSFVSMLYSMGSYAATTIKLSKATTSKFEITQTTDKNVQYANFSISKITATNEATKNGTFARLTADGMLNMGEVGKPELPSIVELIEVPQKATVKLTVVSYNTETIALSSKGVSYKVMPFQEDVSKSSTPTFSYNSSAYSKNAYINTQTAKFELCGVLRDTRFGRLTINPIQYNASTNTIKVLNNLKVKIEFVNADYTATSSLKTKAGSDVARGLTSTFIQSNIGDGTTLKSGSYTKETMIIVANSTFKSDMTRFVEHKKKMGLNVIEHYVASGTTRDAIKKTIKSDYDNPPSGYKKPLYLLLVGDIDFIPSWGPYDGCEIYYTDLYYATVEGDDYIPDMFYGRFSANNSAELTPQIDKTIEYETYSMPDPSYLYNATLVAGWDKTYYTEANSQMHYAENVYCTEENNFTTNAYYQNGNSEISFTSDIARDVNKGAGLVNYSAHGGQTSWSGQFSISDIKNLTNEHKYGLWIGNCCLTNRFQVNECFGEALLRQPKKGAVGYVGATCCSHWGSDYYWAVGYRSYTKSFNPQFDANNIGMFDKLFHTNISNKKDKFSTQGAIVYAGNLSVEKVGANKYYWEIYQLMGDPSVYVRFTPPTECDEDMNIVSGISDGLQHNEFIANRSITATNKITNKSNVHYGANYKVLLKKGFKVASGCKFRANNYGCNEGNINALRKGYLNNDSFETDEEEFDGERQVVTSLYPNPTDGEFTIFFGEESEEGNSVIITDLTGKVIYSEDGLGSEVSINLSGKVQGVYIVKAISNGNIYTEKLILK